MQMQLKDQQAFHSYPDSSQFNPQQQDIQSLPLPFRIKHPSWSVRKATYEQLFYYLTNISSSNQQIFVSGNSYTIETLLPLFQNLIQEKHAVVLLKGLQCVQNILLLDKKFASKHCIKTLIDKGIQYFPLLSQQRKAILQKFLDILQLGKVDATFLKNKLNLPHEKSVMYVIQVISVLNIISLKSLLSQISKKHQKRCVRELAGEIAEQMQEKDSQRNEEKIQLKVNEQKVQKNSKPQQSSNCKVTIQKLPHYEQLISKKQQQYSIELFEKIESIIAEYSIAQLPNFSHILRLMIEDNNHIININAIKCLIAIFLKEKNLTNKQSLVPLSFPLLFLFNKFKSHKTHPINVLMLSLSQAILQSNSNRLFDLFLAISEGLSSSGSKANLKFGCGLTFFRVISLLYQNQDLYACTINQNIESQNQDLQQKFNQFVNIKLSKNQLKIVQKIIQMLEKDKKYEAEIFLTKYAIGIQNNTLNSKDELNKQLDIGMNKSLNKQPKILRTKKNHDINAKKYQVNQQRNVSIQNKNKTQNLTKKNLFLTKAIQKGKEHLKFESINVQNTLNTIIKSLDQFSRAQNKKMSFNHLEKLLQKSSEEFYQCVRQRRYEMFYLCELLERFIQNYHPNESTIEPVSNYLIELLKIISLLKPLLITSPESKQISLHNVSQLLIVALCRLAISQEIQQVLENLLQNYGFQTIYQSIQTLFLKTTTNKIKKKNKKFLLQWLEANVPALYLDSNYYHLIENISQKEVKQKQKQTTEIPHQQIVKTKSNINTQTIVNKKLELQKSPSQQKKSPIKKDTKWIIQALIGQRKEVVYDLDNINVSKIENQNIESNDFSEDMEKSSFHQNLEWNLRQIETNRSFQEEVLSSSNNFDDLSREYLRNAHYQQLKNGHFQQFKKGQFQQFKKQKKNENKILSSSPLRQEQLDNKSLDEQKRHNKIDTENSLEEDGEQKQKFEKVEKRRLERARERKEFLDRIKQQYRPIMPIDDQDANDQNQNQQSKFSETSDSEQTEQIIASNIGSSMIRKKPTSQTQQQNRLKEQLIKSYNYQQNQQENSKNNIQGQEYSQEYASYQSNYRPAQNKNQDQLVFQIPQHQTSFIPQTRENYQDLTKSNPKNSQQTPNSSFLSSTESVKFKYRLLNHDKISYMLKTTTNPYPHLRTLILIPFKSSQKKNQFLKELIHFFMNQVEFKLPQPYTSLTLVTILMFSQIKQDKTLIQPLQCLYEVVAKQSTTNDFIKTIISLFHTVIEQTMQQSRKFLITILLKSMIRMLPFIEDGVSLLRDIQQFYQIGEMVYFQMFDEEYNQIKNYMEKETVDIVVQKALDQEGYNLRSIVEGWLTTAWKVKVMTTIEEYQHEHENQQQYDEQTQNCESQI